MKENLTEKLAGLLNELNFHGYDYHFYCVSFVDRTIWFDGDDFCIEKLTGGF